MSYVGRRVERTEDQRLLQGRARFVDDIHLPDMLECAFVRSPYAHARLKSVDLAAAREAPGVVAVYALSDIAHLLTSERLPLGFSLEQVDGEVTPFVLAKDELAFVGEAIALIVAENRYLAEDAAVLVDLDAEPLSVVGDARTALDPASPVAHVGKETNLVKRIHHAYGDVDAAFAGASHVVSTSLRQQRGAAHPIEGRGLVARYDALEGRLTVWSSTQMSHEVRATLAKVLGLADDEVRVIVPDVGGGFGAKFLVYPEEVAVSCAARLLGRPLKWVEDRREHFLAAIQAREQYWDVEIAADEEARILGVRGRLIHDQGAYTPQGVNLPYNAAAAVPGPYIVPAYSLEANAVETNRVCTIPVRGAGYPEGTFTMERLLDLLARDMGLDRAEVRRRNLIPADAMPYTTPLVTRAGTPIRYDSGDFPDCQAKALEAIGYEGFPGRQAKAREAGRYLGIGIANGIKGTGRGPFETARVRIGRNGQVTVYTGANAMGQGLKTAFAQIAADVLGLSLEQVDVIAGDTASISHGQGGFASRQTVTAGSAVYHAASQVREKAVAVAAHMLEIPGSDLVVRDGEVHARTDSGARVSLGALAEALAGVPGYALPAGASPGLEAEEHFMPSGLAYANATHAVEVDVDVQTGGVEILRYVVVNDCGRAVNPTLVEGQLHGGVVHGIGNALLESMIYDAEGQPLTVSFAEYLLPSATEAPRIEIIHMESPSPLNPLGIKGVGEAGVVPAPAAVVSAIEDALSPWDVRLTAYPVTPMYIIDLIGNAVSGREAIERARSRED